MARKIMCTLVIALMSSTYVFGQTPFFDCKKVTKGEDYSFPIFSRASAPLTARKINQFLQLSELELLDGRQTDNIFEKISGFDESVGVKPSIFYKIISNNSKLLSIKFDESSCGAACSDWVRYYNFNSGNGDLVQLKDLFTIDGFKNFKKKIFQKRTTQLKNELVRVKETNSVVDEVYDCCKEDDLYDYYIKGSSIFIDAENCLGIFGKVHDLDMITRFDLEEFKNYLNDYGKIIFGIKSGAIARFRSYKLPQLYEGTIDGSLKILLIIKHKNNRNGITGVYAYTKYGRGINLQGELNKQKLTLTEEIGNDEYGCINAIFDGKQLNGTWTKKGKTKAFKLIARQR